jgi:hypothetical protein
MSESDVDNSDHIGKIGYFELYHTERENEEVIKAFTNRDEFETELEVPDGFRGNVASIRDEIYPELVEQHNQWLTSQ